MVGSSSPASPRVSRLVSSPAIGAAHDIKGRDDAQIQCRLEDRLAGEDEPGGFVSLAYKGRCAAAVDQHGVKEMDHAAAVWNIDPALDQIRVCPTVAIFDDPIAQTVLTHQSGVQMPVSVIMPMKADMSVFRRIIIGKITSATAEKHSRAG